MTRDVLGRQSIGRVDEKAKARLDAVDRERKLRNGSCGRQTWHGRRDVDVVLWVASVLRARFAIAARHAYKVRLA